MTKERLTKYLKEQIDFLKLSCESFDKGYLHESKRLATTLRVLLHDTAKSHSLLDQIGIKKKIGFYDTCLDLNPNNLLSHNGILLIHLQRDSAKYKAPLSDTPLSLNHSKPFEEWWEKLVFAKSKNEGYSRKKLILALANKEGGAHVDPKLNKQFESLVNGEYFENFFVSGNDQSPIEEAPAFAVRQIAFEIIKSLEKNKPPNNKPTTLEYLSRPKPIIKKNQPGRNELCLCGSGKKYKKCCLNK